MTANFFSPSSSSSSSSSSSTLHSGSQPSKVPSLAGRVIDSSFRLERRLGSGAFGEVYFARDITSSSSIPYAVKCMRKLEPTHHHHKHQVREYALHELVSDHPNIVTLHSVVDDGEFIYMVLDYAEGGDLFDAMDVYQGNDEKIKSAFVQILDALEYSHNNGVYHRDLKPENVLLKDGSCLLSDFGLATSVTRSKEYGCGSYEYMCPESVPRGAKASEVAFSHVKADVWSLGVLLFNLLSGLSVWKIADPRQDSNFKIFCNNPRLLKEHFNLSEEAFHLLNGMLAVDPLDRVSLPDVRAEVEKISTFYKTKHRSALIVPELSPTSSRSVSLEDGEGPLTPETHALDSGVRVKERVTTKENDMSMLTRTFEAKTRLDVLNRRISTIRV